MSEDKQGVLLGVAMDRYQKVQYLYFTIITNHDKNFLTVIFQTWNRLSCFLFQLLLHFFISFQLLKINIKGKIVPLKLWARSWIQKNCCIKLKLILKKMVNKLHSLHEKSKFRENRLIKNGEKQYLFIYWLGQVIKLPTDSPCQRDRLQFCRGLLFIKI